MQLFVKRKVVSILVSFHIYGTHSQFARFPLSSAFQIYKYVCTSCVKTLQSHKPPYFLHFICQLTQKKKRKKNRNERVLSTNTRNSVRRNSYRFNNCVSPALIFIIYAHPKIGIQKFRREMDLIASPSERFKLIFNSAFQRHPVFLSLKNFSISKQLKTWKNRY